MMRPTILQDPKVTVLPYGIQQAAMRAVLPLKNLTYDVFCSGTAVLPDGRPLIAGGTQNYAFTGDNRASIYNPHTNQFPQSQSMVNGRWYAK